MSDTHTLAQALADAHRQHRALASAPWQHTLGDAADAYAVQDQVAAALGWFAGTPVRAWKSGGPSRDAALTHAALPPVFVRSSPADLSDRPLHTPGVEAEIAMRLGESISPTLAAQLQPADAEALIDAMTVSIEIVDSRWLEGTQAPALLRLADLQSHAALVLGAWVPYERRDWSAQRCTVQIGEREAVEHSGTHSLGDPAWLLPTWLRHATRDGASVPAGSVVTTGTWCGLLPVRPGELVRVEFDGIGSASVQM